MNKTQLNLILKELKIIPNKNLGQNFLIDDNITTKIINESEISNKDTILEIGPGLGILTEKLIQKAQKVYAIEIDTRLCSYLAKKFSSHENIEIINNDILKIDLPVHNKVVSNIPYSITGPILEKVFFKNNPPIGILTIEKKIADRIFSLGNYNNISRITITVNSFMIPVKHIKISRNCFYPLPKIDLTLIKLKPNKNMDPYLSEEKFRRFYLKFIAGIMPYKNKNLSKALFLYFRTKPELNLTKENILEILYQNNFVNEKVFTLKISDFIKLSKIIYNLK